MNVEREKLAECLILEYSGDSADIDKSTDPGQQVADYRLIDSVSRLMWFIE